MSRRPPSTTGGVEPARGWHELDGFLSRPLPLEAHRPEIPDLIGQRVGPFTLVRLLGRGGMGCVYLAERHDGAFDQRVAVKLIPRALLHDEARRRFQVEVRALARLEHPGIARILDCGVTSDGLPFLVMEYVEGEPIDHYCDRRGLGVEGRIRMLLGVAEAVRFAHSRLVVHRDLKPANILVVPPGRVKLLDFGIAKLLSEDEDGPTQTGLWPCTPQYAAPEQLTAGSVTDRDRRLRHRRARLPPARRPPSVAGRGRCLDPAPARARARRT